MDFKEKVNNLSAYRGTSLMEMMAIMGLTPSDFVLEEIQDFINMGGTSREEIVEILSTMEKIVSVEDLRAVGYEKEDLVPGLSVEEALAKLVF